MYLQLAGIETLVSISDKIMEMLRVYDKQYRPTEWLVEGQTKGRQKSIRK